MAFYAACSNISVILRWRPTYSCNSLFYRHFRGRALKCLAQGRSHKKKKKSGLSQVSTLHLQSQESYALPMGHARPLILGSSYDPLHFNYLPFNSSWKLYCQSMNNSQPHITFLRQFHNTQTSPKQAIHTNNLVLTFLDSKTCIYFRQNI